MSVPISIKVNHSEILTFKRWNVIVQYLEERIEELKNKGYDVRYEIDTGYHNGVTNMDGEGGYSKVHEKILMCSIKASFYVEIMQAIKVIDSEAFVSVVNSYETGYLDKERRKRLRKY